MLNNAMRNSRGLASLYTIDLLYEGEMVLDHQAVSPGAWLLFLGVYTYLNVFNSSGTET